MRAGIAALALLSSTAWGAGPVLVPLPLLEADQSEVQIAAAARFGQSFTPTASSIGTIWLRARNMNLGFPLDQDKWLTLNLHAGDSLGGPVLASSTIDVEAVIGRALGSAGLIEFSFGAVPVLSGQTYSFEVKAASERFGVNWQHNDWYAGGHAIALGGPVELSDLYFSIAAPVPEPSAGQFLLLGLGLLAGLQRWRASAGPTQ